MSPHAVSETVGPEQRAAALGQTPIVVWFTGVSGAGKSTIAGLVEQRLHALGRHTAVLDGDELRTGLCSDLGFSHEDRVENVRRTAEVAALMADAGLVVLVALISPFEEQRRLARARCSRFLEVFVDCPLAVAEARDPKGLYARARRGEVPQFTGISSPYEPPLAPEVHLRVDRLTPDEAAARVVDAIERFS